ncbi:phosphotransferase family protein [Nocardioides guangzhouensis]|uniref:phosphotransferase family protein n=1 Tax=Nocardioides guangzhouensis TaxID=2497878 RepID=UPI00143863F8|nr:aminoglycoside phosphotransferase family protein [Nocardioides guangzhouensis]
MPAPDDVLATLAPGRSGPVRPLGEGWDNLVWAVGDDLVLRVVKDPDPTVKRATVERDVALLAFAGRHSTLAPPRVVAADPEAGALLTTRVPGVAAVESGRLDTSALADDLARFLTALHAVDPVLAAGVVRPDPDSAEVWLAQVGEEYAAVAGDVAPDLRAPVEEFLGAAPPPPAQDLVFCHNDVRDDHVMVDPASGRVTGLIDWGDAVLGDPALDLATVLTDFGPAVLDRVLDGYLRPREAGLADRTRWVARRRMVEDLAWRIRTGDEPGGRRTSATLRRLLAD